jgi:hypothetical protein
VANNSSEDWPLFVPYTADFLPLTINAFAGKFIFPLEKYLRAVLGVADREACGNVETRGREEAFSSGV